MQSLPPHTSQMAIATPWWCCSELPTSSRCPPRAGLAVAVGASAGTVSSVRVDLIRVKWEVRKHGGG